MNNSNIHEVSDSSDSKFLEKMQELIRKLPKYFANCKLQTANSNPGLCKYYKVYNGVSSHSTQCKIHRKTKK